MHAVPLGVHTFPHKPGEGPERSSEGVLRAASSLGRAKTSLEGLGPAPQTSDPPSSPFSLMQALGEKAASEPHQSWSGKIKTDPSLKERGWEGC